MHFSVAYAALLAVPAALASPLALGLEERATVPTCNANNIQLLRSAHPASKTFCSSWKATSTHAGSGITNSVTSLSPSQVTNLCNCLLAPTYVASPGLTSTTKSAATTSAPATVPTCNANNIQLLRSAHPASKTFCSSWKAVPTHSDSGITNSVTSLTPAQVTNLCNCVLASTYVASPGLTSTTSAATTSGASSSSSGASTSSTSTTSASKGSTTVAPPSSSAPAGSSTFGLYVKASTATTSASALQAATISSTVGLYPTPSAKKRAVAERAACASGISTVHGNQYLTDCGTAAGSAAVAGTPAHPGTNDNVNSLTACIAFCDQQGTTNCKGVTWVESTSVCSLYSSGGASIGTVGATTGTDFAYLVAPVQPLSFVLDSSTGYVYDTQFPGSLLGTSGTLVAATSTVAAFMPIILFSSAASPAAPLQCTMASGALSCSVTINGVIYGAWQISDPDTTHNGQQVLGLSIGGSSLSKAVVTTGAIPAGSSTTPYTYTSGNNTVLLSTSDLYNSGLDVSTGTTMTSDSANDINIAFDVQTTGASSQLVAENVPLYTADYYRFTGSISFTYGQLISSVECTASLSIDGASTGLGYFSTFFDYTLPSQFDLVYEGQPQTSEVSTVAFTLSCTSSASEQKYPVVLSNLKLVSNPSPIGSGINATVGATGSQSAFIQYYSGSNSRAFKTSTTAPVQTLIDTAHNTPETAITPTALYVGSQADAIAACAASAVTNKNGFQVFRQNNAWNCALFSDNYASASLFSVSDSTITQVVGYYYSAILTAETNA